MRIGSAWLRTGILACLLVIGAGVSAAAEKQSCSAEILTTPIYWDIDGLATAKSQFKDENSPLKPAFDHLLRSAEKALSAKPYTVTDKPNPGPSGDLKDYVSVSRYFWPNPKTADRMPYIRKDGQTNPEINGDKFDRRRSQLMTNDVTTLALAAYFTGNAAYADKAEELVRTWFLDAKTGMNPHLKYAQGAPGTSEGREFGILDGRIYWDVIDSLLLMQSAGQSEPAFTEEMRGWFGEYAAWLIRSDFGKKARQRLNNHGTYYDAQLAHVLMFVGRCDLASTVAARGHTRTKPQISKTGLMPQEQQRTRSLTYHNFNLQAFIRLAYYARKLGMDYYDEAQTGAGSIRDSVDFIASYAGRVDEWPYKEISDDVEKPLWIMLKNAQKVDDRADISEALARLNYDDPKSDLNLMSAAPRL